VFSIITMTTPVLVVYEPASTGTSKRWMIPVGAVSVHLCIGSVYAWSTFNRPIQVLFADAAWWLNPPYTTFTAALVLLGLSAAFAGPWVERRGPRVAATAAALFFGTGLVIGGVGLFLRQPVIVLVGMGVIAGIGCGLGYIAPVSTLVKWFPDRPGMATGMAIMGFGGGAFIGAYVNVFAMQRIGVPMTVASLGLVYCAVMLAGARWLSSPPAGWRPSLAANQLPARVLSDGLTRNEAIHTIQFYYLWGILFVNVTAGIGILAQAAPMMEDLFGRTPLQAATVVSLISVFNACGRFVWASVSDYLGRRNTFALFFVAQVTLFILIPRFAASGNWTLFQASLFVVFSMYGGGFATMPAFLADVFGPRNVGAIHGALLTAWSAAAVAGPFVITELSARARAGLAPGEARIHIYDAPLQVMGALLSTGVLLTLLVRSVHRGRDESQDNLTGPSVRSKA
jgi:MFS family permease